MRSTNPNLLASLDRFVRDSLRWVLQSAESLQSLTLYAYPIPRKAFRPGPGPLPHAPWQQSQSQQAFAQSRFERAIRGSPPLRYPGFTPTPVMARHNSSTSSTCAELPLASRNGGAAAADWPYRVASLTRRSRAGRRQRDPTTARDLFSRAEASGAAMTVQTSTPCPPWSGGCRSHRSRLFACRRPLRQSARVSGLWQQVGMHRSSRTFRRRPHASRPVTAPQIAPGQLRIGDAHGAQFADTAFLGVP